VNSTRAWKMSLFGAVFALVTCAARRPALKPPELIDRVETTAIDDRSEAVSMLEDYLSGRTDPGIAPWAALWLGEQYRLERRPQEARQQFARFAEQNPTHPLKEAALLGMAVIDAGDDPSGNTLATLQLLEARGAPDTLNADRYRILARVAADDGSSPARIRELVQKSIRYAESDPSVKIRIHQTLGNLLNDEQSSDLTGIDVEDLGSGAGAEQGMYERAEEALLRDNYEEAIALSQRFLEIWPDSDLAAEVGYFIKRAEARDPLSSRKVGVLLPLSGKYAPAARQFKSVIQMANQAEGSPLQLVFADTKGSEATTLAELERLALAEGCVAILGPLLKETVMPAAETAQALHMPMVALSQSRNPTQAGDYVYRGFLPLTQQIDALLDHAIQDRGFNRFAVLYPENSYGQTASDLFVAAAADKGVEVVRRQSYSPGSKSFLDTARKLGDKHSGSGGSGHARNPPTIDYDALFIPDNHKRVALVASSLAYEEFPVGTFRPSRSARGLLLMGLNGWNNPALAEAGGQYVEGSVFVDAFWPSSSDPTISNFVRDYRASHGRAPGVVDAVTYDATRLLARAVKSNSGTREGMRAALDEASLSDPVGTGHAFGADREVQRELMVLTVTSSGIRPWRTTPR